MRGRCGGCGVLGGASSLGTTPCARACPPPRAAMASTGPRPRRFRVERDRRVGTAWCGCFLKSERTPHVVRGVVLGWTSPPPWCGRAVSTPCSQRIRRTLQRSLRLETAVRVEVARGSRIHSCRVGKSLSTSVLRRRAHTTFRRRYGHVPKQFENRRGSHPLGRNMRHACSRSPCSTCSWFAPCRTPDRRVINLTLEHLANHGADSTVTALLRTFVTSSVAEGWHRRRALGSSQVL